MAAVVIIPVELVLATSTSFFLVRIGTLLLWDVLLASTPAPIMLPPVI